MWIRYGATHSLHASLYKAEQPGPLRAGLDTITDQADEGGADGVRVDLARLAERLRVWFLVRKEVQRLSLWQWVSSVCVDRPDRRDMKRNACFGLDCGTHCANVFAAVLCYSPPFRYGPRGHPISWKKNCGALPCQHTQHVRPNQSLTTNRSRTQPRRAGVGSRCRLTWVDQSVGVENKRSGEGEGGEVSIVFPSFKLQSTHYVGRRERP